MQTDDVGNDGDIECDMGETPMNHRHTSMKVNDFYLNKKQRALDISCLGHNNSTGGEDADVEAETECGFEFDVELDVADDKEMDDDGSSDICSFDSFQSAHANVDNRHTRYTFINENQSTLGKKITKMPLDSGNQMHTMHNMNHINHTFDNSSSFMVQDDLKLMRLLEDMHLEESEINRLMLLKSNITCGAPPTKTNSPLRLNLMDQNSLRKLLDLNIVEQLHTCSSSSSSQDGDIDTTPPPPQPQPQPAQLASSSSARVAGKHDGVANDNGKPMLKDLVELDQDMDYLEDQLDLNEMKKPDPAFLHELNDIDGMEKVPTAAPDCDSGSIGVGSLGLSGSEICQMIKFKRVRDDQAGSSC
ncbi:unnamed protein product [Ambrosiozyma monospora]|uniref:Unnamed protein product n=1 Tax=Ambrosiozyma monospora TaxID=43982 RepID=A0A9W6Z535_AMBMO|nr:unnamed protein product [Ambrosiozyma monospora]